MPENEKSACNQNNNTTNLKHTKRTWFLSMVLLPILLGILLLCMFSFIDSWFYKIKPLSWHKLFGVWLIWIGVADLITKFLLNIIGELFGLPNQDDEATEKACFFSGSIQGMCERILYPFSFLIRKPEFIGAWILFKVASQWSGWERGENKGIKARLQFNKFIIGNALSIIFGVLIYVSFKIFVPELEQWELF